MKNLIKLAGDVLMVQRGGRFVSVASEDGASIVLGCRRGGDA